MIFVDFCRSENRVEYINLVKEKNFTQFMPAFAQIKKGFYEFFNYTNMRFINSTKLEQKLCGMQYVRS